MAVIPVVKLGFSAQKVPVIGMGTSSSSTDVETQKSAMVEAIRAGYRHFDTAFLYGSEHTLGEAIEEALRLGLIKSRDELFITTKLWCTFAERDQVVPALNMSLKNLKLEYVDMYLIHWPMKLSPQVVGASFKKEDVFPMDIKSVWEGMEECHGLGLTKGIGVSNFPCKKLEELLSIAKIPPAINQVEMNPLWQQKRLRELCKEKGVHITAYSPLGSYKTAWGDNRIMESGVLEEIAKARGKTIAQVSLRWVYEQGVSMVTKSFNKERMRENLEIFDWSLTEEELSKISQLPQRKGITLTASMGPCELATELDAE